MKRIEGILLVVLAMFVGCSTAAKEEPAMEKEPSRYRIACLGDSITEGVGVNDPDNLWVNVIGQADFIIKAQNVGSSGTTIAVPPDEALRPFAFVNRYREIDERAALIFVFGGTNDYGNDVVLGTIGDTDPSTFYGALRTLIEGLKADYPDAMLLFATPLQRDDQMLGAPVTTPFNAAGATMEDYRKAILDICTEYGVETLDLYNYPGMRLSDETFSVYFDDGLHPNDAGSQYLSEPILSKIRKMLSK